ncbi:MAG: copper resistance protein B [Thermoanaerobaculia bacterium]|nr:copper resistance protein B [Thermoanaerobaculia bacterium]
MPDRRATPAILLGLLLAAAAVAPLRAAPDAPRAARSVDRPQGHDTPGGDQSSDPSESPALPEGATLEEVLERAANPPPERFGHPVMDDALYVFTLFEQLEARFTDDDGADHLGWEAQGWAGGDSHKFWWKSEGAATIEGPQTGEAETDLLYSRLISPFWSVQVGAQYADGWGDEETASRWSGVVALQGLAPYRFEVDGSLYLSEEGEVTFELEGEYELRVTQRHVLQPKLELALAAGLTAVDLDLRWRYEIRRELAPYLGIAYQRLLGETAEIVEAAGEESDRFLVVTGVRFAF